MYLWFRLSTIYRFDLQWMDDACRRIRFLNSNRFSRWNPIEPTRISLVLGSGILTLQYLSIYVRSKAGVESMWLQVPELPYRANTTALTLSIRDAVAPGAEQAKGQESSNFSSQKFAGHCGYKGVGVMDFVALAATLPDIIMLQMSDQYMCSLDPTPTPTLGNKTIGRPSNSERGNV
ncbi:hypothetical protein B0H13DRAFT_1910115 [Mycena leptocephala]|nr:hypothetical protein B0H13DRAFT_1910115 [Mycena leptocephala]